MSFQKLLGATAIATAALVLTTTVGAATLPIRTPLRETADVTRTSYPPDIADVQLGFSQADAAAREDDESAFVTLHLTTADRWAAGTCLQRGLHALATDFQRAVLHDERISARGVLHATFGNCLPRLLRTPDARGTQALVDAMTSAWTEAVVVAAASRPTAKMLHAWLVSESRSRASQAPV
jgi:hypothetical protein